MANQYRARISFRSARVKKDEGKGRCRKIALAATTALSAITPYALDGANKQESEQPCFAATNQDQQPALSQECRQQVSNMVAPECNISAPQEPQLTQAQQPQMAAASQPQSLVQEECPGCRIVCPHQMSVQQGAPRQRECEAPRQQQVPEVQIFRQSPAQQVAPTSNDSRPVLCHQCFVRNAGPRPATPIVTRPEVQQACVCQEARPVKLGDEAGEGCRSVTSGCVHFVASSITRGCRHQHPQCQAGLVNDQDRQMISNGSSNLPLQASSNPTQGHRNQRDGVVSYPVNLKIPATIAVPSQARAGRPQEELVMPGKEQSTAPAIQQAPGTAIQISLIREAAREAAPAIQYAMVQNAGDAAAAKQPGPAPLVVPVAMISAAVPAVQAVKQVQQQAQPQLYTLMPVHNEQKPIGTTTVTTTTATTAGPSAPPQSNVVRVSPTVGQRLLQQGLEARMIIKDIRPHSSHYSLDCDSIRVGRPRRSNSYESSAGSSYRSHTEAKVPWAGASRVKKRPSKRPHTPSNYSSVASSSRTSGGSSTTSSTRSSASSSGSSSYHSSLLSASGSSTLLESSVTGSRRSRKGRGKRRGH